MRRNILVADDDEQIRELVSFFLKQAGFAVRAVRDGYSAIAEFEANHFDLLILDINLPHMNGFQVLKTLRDKAATSGLPVIMLTGSAEKEDIVKAKEFEISDYIIKPPKKDDVISRVERILGGRPQYEEIKFELDSSQAKGTLSFNVQLQSLSRSGLILKAEVPVEKGSTLSGLKLTLFDSIGITDAKFTVADCTPSNDGGYEYFVSFIGMSQQAQEKIREWIMQKTFNERNQTAKD